MIKNLVRMRYFSSTISKYQNNLEFLFNHHSVKLNQPYFTARSGNIEILKDPIDFYVALHVSVEKEVINYKSKVFNQVTAE